MNLNETAKQVRKIAADHGFISVVEEDWYKDIRRVCTSLALIHSEVSEALEAVRLDNKSNFFEELADAVIRVLDLVGAFPVDFENVISKKIEFNKNRPQMHGGKRI